MSKRTPNGPVTATVGVFSFFGLWEDTQVCFQALEPIFFHAHSVFDVIKNVENLNQLEKGGAFLYSGLECISCGGLIWATYTVVRHHFHKVKHQVMLARVQSAKPERL